MLFCFFFIMKLQHLEPPLVFFPLYFTFLDLFYSMYQKFVLNDYLIWVTRPPNTVIISNLDWAQKWLNHYRKWCAMWTQYKISENQLMSCVCLVVVYILPLRAETDNSRFINNNDDDNDNDNDIMTIMMMIIISANSNTIMGWTV